jgi:hypothetical protein
VGKALQPCYHQALSAVFKRVGTRDRMEFSRCEGSSDMVGRQFQIARAFEERRVAAASPSLNTPQTISKGRCKTLAGRSFRHGQAFEDGEAS